MQSKNKLPLSALSFSFKIGGGIFLGLIVLGSILWTLMVVQVRSSTEAYLKDTHKNGIEISYKDLSVSSYFPSVTITINDLKIKAPLGYTLESSTLSLHSSIWRPFALTVKSPYLTILCSETINLALAFEGIHYESSLWHFKEKGTFKVGAFIFSGENQLKVHGESLNLSFEHETLTARNDQGDFLIPSLKFKGSLPTLKIEDTQGGTLAELTKLEMKATLSDPASLENLGKKPISETLDLWRENGGALDIESLSGDWLPLSGVIEGTLALDHTLFPEGALTVELTGLPEFLKELYDNPNIPENNRVLFELSSGFLGKTLDSLTLPIRIQNRVMNIGSFLQIPFEKNT